MTTETFKEFTFEAAHEFRPSRHAWTFFQGRSVPEG